MLMKMAKVELSLRLGLSFHEAFNRHDVPAMLNLLSEQCLFESAGPPPDGAVYAGKEAIAQFWQTLFRQYPNVHCEIEEIFGWGDRCVVYWRRTWVNERGEAQHLRGVDTFRVKDNQIGEHRSYVKGG